MLGGWPATSDLALIKALRRDCQCLTWRLTWSAAEWKVRCSVTDKNELAFQSYGTCIHSIFKGQGFLVTRYNTVQHSTNPFAMGSDESRIKNETKIYIVATGVARSSAPAISALRWTQWRPSSG